MKKSQIENKTKLHFIGIGGIAMAACAAMFKRLGYIVTGSDKNIYEPALGTLAENDIKTFPVYSTQNVKKVKADIYVVGNAISRGNLELEEVLNSGFYYTSLPEILKTQILNYRKNIVVTGTHGKTTTTSLVAFMLHFGGLNPGFMIGGKAGNFDMSAKAGVSNGWFAIEGDEYDTYAFDKRSKFFHYPPKIVIINNIEFDHVDIFKTLYNIKLAFKLMLRQLPQNGHIIVNGDDKNALQVAKAGFSKVISFGFSKKCDARITKVDFSQKPPHSNFCFVYNNKTINLTTNLIGEFNVKNSLAAALAAKISGLGWPKIKAGLINFKPNFRRLTRLDKKGKIKIFDDFAHHPTAILANIKTLKRLYPNQKLHVVYEPKSNTAISNFHQQALIDALIKADSITICPSNRWYNKPTTKRLDLNKIAFQIGQKLNIIYDQTQVLKNLKNSLKVGDLVIFMAQTDFGKLPEKLATYADSLTYDKK